MTMRSAGRFWVLGVLAGLAGWPAWAGVTDDPLPELNDPPAGMVLLPVLSKTKQHGD